MPVQDKTNPWGLSEGLPLDGADVTVTDCVFLVDNEYAVGALVASFTLIPDHYDGDIGNLRPQLYSLGKGWEAVDRGARAEHESGKFRQFSKMSSYGSWIAAALECEGAPEYLSERDPRDADTWIGTRWTLGTVMYKPMQGEEKPRIVPIAFLGTAEESGKKVGGTAKKASGPAKKTTGPTPRPKAESNGSGSGLDAETDGALRELAKENDDFDTFMAQAFEWMENNDKAGDNAIETAVMSKRQWVAWRNS